MTPQPQKSKAWGPIATGIVSLSVLMLAALLKTAVGIYNNQLTMQVKMDVMQQSIYERKIDQENIRIHMADQDNRLSRIETLLQTSKK